MQVSNSKYRSFSNKKEHFQTFLKRISYLKYSFLMDIYKWIYSNDFKNLFLMLKA